MKTLLQILLMSLTLLMHVDIRAEQTETTNGLMDKVESLYSAAELEAKLAVSANAAACVETGCEENQVFDDRVQQLGAELSARAYARYPQLRKEVPQFLFSIAEKSDLALASNKQGHVVVFRGVQDLMLSDHALKFLLAREMAHVIAKHHDKNISTKLIISALTAVAFPAVAIVAASQAAAEVSTVTSVVTSVASTATSLVGSEVAIAQLKPRQLIEADKIALALTQEDEIDFISLSAELMLTEQASSWQKDLLKTQAFIVQLSEEKADAMMVDLDYKNAQQEPENVY